MKHELFIEKFEDRWSFRLFDHTDCLLVILERDIIPRNTFHLVLFLLHCEHMLVELLLELLVRIVDTQLLVGILGENFKAEDVEQANECQFALASSG